MEEVVARPTQYAGSPRRPAMRGQSKFYAIALPQIGADSRGFALIAHPHQDGYKSWRRLTAKSPTAVTRLLFSGANAASIALLTELCWRCCGLPTAGIVRLGGMIVMFSIDLRVDARSIGEWDGCDGKSLGG